MKAILYMLGKTVKNGITDILHHPIQLIVYLFIILTTVSGVVRSLTSNIGAEETYFDFRILQGAYLLILYFVSVPIMLKGTNASTTFFKMSDVANIFTAPISEKRILVYGVGRQMITILMLLVCFVSYGAMAVRFFSLTVLDAVFLMLGVGVMLFEVQMITILIFCLCNGKPARIRLMKYAIYFIIIIPIAIALLQLFTKGFTYENFLEAISLPYLNYIPIVGWTSGLFMGIIIGNAIQMLVYGGLLILFMVFTIAVFMLSKADYYEDVLQKTESVYEFRNAIKTGKVSDKNMMNDKKQVRIGRMGIKRGTGATTFLFKQYREMSRRSRIPFLNVNTAVLTAFVVIVGFALKAFESSEITASMILTIVSILSCYIQFFFTVSDDWIKELQKPYIFMVPANSVKKLVMACATSVIKPLIDGVIAFMIGGILFRANFLDVLACITIYFSCGLLYTSLNVLVQRFMGKVGNRGVLMVVYMLLMFVALIPGIVVSAIMFLTSSAQISYNMLLASRLCFPAAVCNFVVSFLIFLISKRTLDNMEY